MSATPEQVTVVAVFADTAAAEHAASELIRLGVPEDALAVAGSTVSGRVSAGDARDFAEALERLGGRIQDSAPHPVVPATDVRFEPFTEAILELPEFTEEIVATRRPYVVEEVVLTRRVVERTETVRETLLKHDVAVEDADS